jgi:hypothetical protein
VQLVALLTIERNLLDDFRAYEHRAAQIMRAHGGRLERALVLDDGAATLRELHIVRFPSAAAFDAYRADPALVALRPDRERCVVSTEIWPASDGPAY